MKFEKLNENKLRITLNINDLADNNIDYQSFMSNSVDTQKLFSDMLDKAEKEVGFSTTNYKIMIEALVTSKGDFIVTITRYIPNEISNNKKKTLSVKRKYTSINQNQLIYSFNTFDDFCLFSNSIDKTFQKNIDKISRDFSLYLYKNTYYFFIKDMDLNYKYTKQFLAILSEYANPIHNSEIFKYKLSEYGKIIFKHNAIKRCVKYFK